MEARTDARLRTTTGGTSGDDVGPRLPASPTPTSPGWYRDPYDMAKQRFWDGSAWSAPISAGTVATVDSVRHLLAG